MFERASERRYQSVSKEPHVCGKRGLLQILLLCIVMTLQSALRAYKDAHKDLLTRTHINQRARAPVHQQSRQHARGIINTTS